ncbi:MAG: insulinase family protein, partial [Calditrichia bacterium]|nr:insulinase family protein [Calditrichia bacterium]
SVAFHAHPYKWSVMGYESDIKNWTKNDLQKYFKTYYAPNNCVVVFVGDVTVKQIKKLTTKYFEPIPAQKPPRKIHTVEPEQKGEKRVFVQKSVSTPNIMIAYHVPETGSEEYYALDLLNSILSAGNSSRLYSALVDEKQLVTRIFTHLPFSLNPNLLYIYTMAAYEITTEQIENAIYAEIKKIIKEGITEKELQKVKNQKLMGFYKNIETINGKANNLGRYELYFGDYKKLFDAPAEYQKVSAEQIQNIAKKYLKKSNRTVGILTPDVEG